ncbi:hypothetical protein [Curvibacter fontanus]
MSPVYTRHENTAATKKGLALLQGLLDLAPRPGLEPGTYGLTVLKIVIFQ